MKNTAIRFDRSLINPKGDSVRYLELSMKAPTPPRDAQPAGVSRGSGASSRAERCVLPRERRAGFWRG